MKRNVLVFFSVSALLLGVALFAIREYSVSPAHKDVLTLHVTSDMHAGGKEKRDYSDERPGNIVYPREWKDYYGRMLETKGDIYLTLGDNISDSGHETRMYKEIAVANEERKRKDGGAVILHTIGNHDNREKFAQIWSQENSLPEKGYYRSYDFEKWRIIILDTEELPGGTISPAQFDWLKSELNMDKKVLVAMHRPVLDYDLKTPLGGWGSTFMEIVGTHPNIKYVLMGHYHIILNKTSMLEAYPDTKFIFVQALTLKDHKGDFVTLTLE
jgi:3',5'-cyclic AMP phosphodiesterase CpdA